MFIDAKKAHLVGECQKDVYEELTEEAGVQSDERGKLKYWLYGCRRARRAWEDHYSKVLVGTGFQRALSSPVALCHPGRDLLAVVHGDDFAFLGADAEVDFALQVLRKHYEIKTSGRL